jgi:upstream activation factor subunit UAF30
MTEPTEEAIVAKVKELVETVDTETLTIKSFLKLLSAEMGVDLKPRKDFIKQALTDAMAEASDDEEGNEGDDQGESDDDDDDDESESEILLTKKSKRSGGGLAAEKEISESLAAFFGGGDKMARTEVVKRLWEYIRKHNLQNPSNGREILLDGPMKKVFGCDTFTMFTMNKYIGAHIHPFKPVDLSTNSSLGTPTRESRKRKAAAKGSTTPKKRKAGTQPPYQLSDELAAVVGKSIMPRPQVVSEIWTYIKANNLQNPSNKREIICDDALRKVMKKDKVTMFNMNQCITPHLLEKLDKGAYTHEVKDEDDNSE